MSTFYLQKTDKVGVVYSIQLKSFYVCLIVYVFHNCLGYTAHLLQIKLLFCLQKGLSWYICWYFQGQKRLTCSSGFFKSMLMINCIWYLTSSFLESLFTDWSFWETSNQRNSWDIIYPSFFSNRKCTFHISTWY